MYRFGFGIFCVINLSSCTRTTEYDLVIRNAKIYDGTGNAPQNGIVAINADTIAALGDLNNVKGRSEVDAQGMAVAPGFINMLSWATETLIEDGRSQSDIRQGVTLEVFGEGWSMGPLNDKMKQEVLEQQSDIKFEVKWTTLGEYLDALAQRGISTSIASFVGATTVRIHTVGYENRPPNAEELEEMPPRAARHARRRARCRLFVNLCARILCADRGVD